MRIVLLRGLYYVDRLLMVDSRLKFYGAKIRVADQKLGQCLRVFVLFISKRVENTDLICQLSVPRLCTVNEQETSFFDANGIANLEGDVLIHLGDIGS